MLIPKGTEVALGEFDKYRVAYAASAFEWAKRRQTHAVFLLNQGEAEIAASLHGASSAVVIARPGLACQYKAGEFFDYHGHHLRQEDAVAAAIAFQARSIAVE
jgi:hypothetical protein